MAISLRRGKLEPAQASRLWRHGAQSSAGTLDHADQEITGLLDLAPAGAHSFKLLFGGILLLLVFELIHQHITSSILAGLLLAHLTWLTTATRRSGRARLALAELRQRAAQQEQTQAQFGRTRRAAEWQRLNLRVGDCTTIAALEQLATERAAAIAGAPVMVELFSAMASTTSEAGARVFRLAITGSGGWLTVFAVEEALDQAQRSTLEHLVILVGIQAVRLRGDAGLARQQAALMTLWEVSGVLRSALDPHEAMREACARIAEALDFNWLALLAPDERQSLAVLLIARGCAEYPAPRLTGAQLRVAAEALRAERTLVRSEGRHTFTCLPVWFSGSAPVVLVAHGEQMDAAAQALLMLLGEMVVDRLARTMNRDRQNTVASGQSRGRVPTTREEESDRRAHREVGRDTQCVSDISTRALGELH